MTAWQTLQTHDRFDFRVKLFAGAMVVIEPDHLFQRQLVETAPIGIELILGKQQLLASLGKPFGNFKYGWIGQRFAVNAYTGFASPYTLALTTKVLFTGFLCQINPGKR